MPHVARTSHRTARSFVIAAGAAFALWVGSGTMTRAHAQSMYGSMQSSVTINYSVLDHLGPAPRVPDGRFVLHVPARHPVPIALRHIRHRRVIARRVVHHPVRRMTRAQPIGHLPEMVQVGSVTIDYAALPPRVASSGPRLVLRRPGSVNVAAAAPAVERPPAPLTPPAATHAAPQMAVLSRPAPRPPALPTPVVPPAPRVATAPASPELKRSDLSELSSLLPIGGVALAATRSPTEPVTGASAPPSDTRAIRFTPGSAQLLGDASDMLSRVAQQLKANPGERIALVAYASGDAAQAIQARRVSLERAVMVRAYLIQHGVDSTRIDVRALGNRVTDGGTADRVDLVTTGR